MRPFCWVPTSSKSSSKLPVTSKWRSGDDQVNAKWENSSCSRELRLISLFSLRNERRSLICLEIEMLRTRQTVKIWLPDSDNWLQLGCRYPPTWMALGD